MKPEPESVTKVPPAAGPSRGVSAESVMSRAVADAAVVNDEMNGAGSGAPVEALARPSMTRRYVFDGASAAEGTTRRVVPLSVSVVETAVPVAEPSSRVSLTVLGERLITGSLKVTSS